MDDNVIGRALTQSQVSHYGPKSNRCYVQLDVMTADLIAPPEKSYRSTFPYDGQTGEILATVRNEQGKCLRKSS
jgi:hypothetical protein